jgi:hypothetical protein
MMAQLSPITKSWCLSYRHNTTATCSQRFAVLDIQARRQHYGALGPEENPYLVGYGKEDFFPNRHHMGRARSRSHRSLLLALQGACEPSDTASWVRATFGFAGFCTLVRD